MAYRFFSHFNRGLFNSKLVNCRKKKIKHIVNVEEEIRFCHSRRPLHKYYYGVKHFFRNSSSGSERRTINRARIDRDGHIGNGSKTHNWCFHRFWSCSGNYSYWPKCGGYSVAETIFEPDVSARFERTIIIIVVFGASQCGFIIVGVVVPPE